MLQLVYEIDEIFAHRRSFNSVDEVTVFALRVLRLAAQRSLMLRMMRDTCVTDIQTNMHNTCIHSLCHCYSDDTLAGFPAPVSSACFWR